LSVSESVERAWGLRRREFTKQAKIVIVILFDGEKDVFNFRASTFSFNPKHAMVDEGEL
jgi:hypothetical protein